MIYILLQNKLDKKCQSCTIFKKSLNFTKHREKRDIDMGLWEEIKNKKRIVIKVGTTTITHEQTGNINLGKLEKFVRVLTDIRNQGKEVIVVSSGSVAVGRTALGIEERPREGAMKQACAAVGQAKLMMIYEKFFSEYSQMTAQILLTKEAILNQGCRKQAKIAFEKLLNMNVIPIVNENDAIAVDEELYGVFGDNDTMAAQVAALVGADLLILMSDIDGLYTDDPKSNPDAQLIHTVRKVDGKLEDMAKGSGSDHGTGGMRTKLEAARIIMEAEGDMVIANGEDISIIYDIMDGKQTGTLFVGRQNGGNKA